MMDREEALPILERITRHWGTRLSQGQHDHWVETLTPLDPGVAGTAYVKLQKKCDRTPSPAEFLAEYRTLRTYDASQPRAAICHECDGTGVVTDLDHPHHWTGPADTIPKHPDGYCECNVVTWCQSCDDGRTRARDMLARINHQRPHQPDRYPPTHANNRF